MSLIDGCRIIFINTILLHMIQLNGGRTNPLNKSLLLTDFVVMSHRDLGSSHIPCRQIDGFSAVKRK